MKTYSCDFETTTQVDDCRVWAYGIVNIENDHFEYGNNITDFMRWCSKSSKKLYFHNLKFDGEFIISWLLKNGYTYNIEKEMKTFSCIVSGLGQFYQIEIVFPSGKKVKILDSFKKLPFSVDQVAKAFNLDIEKLDLDYEKPRPIGYELEPYEVDYLKNDSLIIAKALKIQFDNGLKKMTVGSDALNSFKNTLSKKLWRANFPILPNDIDAFLRKSYKGGFVWVNPLFQGLDIGNGLVFDVNSLYPSVMYNDLLPIGIPHHFKGQYKFDKDKPLYIQKIEVDFTLKKDKIPTIQIKGSSRFVSTDYISDSNGVVELTLTNVDLQLLLDHYDVHYINYVEGYKFSATRGIFKTYIDYWGKIKMENKGAMRTLAKLMLNSLYGKFGTNPKVESKYPYLENGIVRWSKLEVTEKDPVYIPMASFITAYAREKTIRTAQTVYPRFLYADTDSIHLVGSESPNIEIHDVEIGKWKLEGNFSKARFIRPKTYVEVIDGKTHITCAGMPQRVKENVTFDEFKQGLVKSGKLLPKKVVGGVVLQDTEFTLH